VNILVVVIPVLLVLMFTLGLEQDLKYFKDVIKYPKPLCVGLLGQLFFLPAVAFFVCVIFSLPPELALGVMLISLCPGGSSSNAITMIAKGNTTLSIVLTTITSFVSVVSIPFFINIFSKYFFNDGSVISLSFFKTFMQNFTVIILPILIGMMIRKYAYKRSLIIGAFLKKISLPLLLLMIFVFVFKERSSILNAIGTLTLSVNLLILGTIFLGLILSKQFKLPFRDQKTITIEIGIQNAAQAMSIALGPFLLNNSTMAMPAIVYAVYMNIWIFGYLIYLKRVDLKNALASS